MTAVYLRIEGLDPSDLLDADSSHEESAAHDLADRTFAAIHHNYPRLYDDLTGVVPVIRPEYDPRLLQGLDEGNDLEYLLGLADEARRSDAFDSDSERAEWVVAQYCQELQYVPDLRDKSTGQTVGKHEVPDDLETARLRNAGGGDA